MQHSKEEDNINPKQKVTIMIADHWCRTVDDSKLTFLFKSKKSGVHRELLKTVGFHNSTQFRL